MTNDTSSGFLQETWTDKSDKRTMASYSASALITNGLIHISQQHHLKTGRFTKAQIRHTGESIKAMMAFHSCLKPDSPVWATYQLYCRILYLFFYWIDANQNLNLSLLILDYVVYFRPFRPTIAAFGTWSLACFRLCYSHLASSVDNQ